MDGWQQMAILPWRDCVIAEVDELGFLLREDHTFTTADLCDRLRALIQYIELGTWNQPHEETNPEWWQSDDIPTAADPAEAGSEPQPIVYMPTPPLKP